MKKLVLVLALFGFFGAASHAAETVGEKAAATTNDAKRAVKKGAHRAGEAMCAEGDAKCLKNKAENRVQEGSDYTKDKAKEVKNNVD
jgi:hypothetical protein